MPGSGQRLSADDLLVLLAVGRSGRYVTAAEELGINHTTIARRIAALEQSLGGRLMISSPTPIMGSDYGPAFPLPIYVTPVRWKQHEGLLILALERA